MSENLPQLRRMPHQYKKYIVAYLEERLSNPNAEQALKSLREIFNHDELEKTLGYKTKNGSIKRIKLARVRYILGVYNNPEFPCLVEVEPDKIVTVDYHDVKY